jgi:8-oxo-dGTP pyrophosphatase MutT (NUDIX family)
VAYQDLYRLSAHAVIIDSQRRVLLLKSAYGSLAWELPGGALGPGETAHECVARECQEELGQNINVLCLTGVYYHKVHSSHAFIFRAELCSMPVVLSPEHSDFRYFALEELGTVQRTRVEVCLRFNGEVASASSEESRPSIEQTSCDSFPSSNVGFEPITYPTSIKGVLLVKNSRGEWEVARRALRRGRRAFSDAVTGILGGAIR